MINFKLKKNVLKSKNKNKIMKKKQLNISLNNTNKIKKNKKYELKFILSVEEPHYLNKFDTSLEKKIFNTINNRKVKIPTKIKFGNLYLNKHKKKPLFISERSYVDKKENCKSENVQTKINLSKTTNNINIKVIESRKNINLKNIFMECTNCGEIKDKKYLNCTCKDCNIFFKWKCKCGVYRSTSGLHNHNCEKTMKRKKLLKKFKKERNIKRKKWLKILTPGGKI